MRRGGGQPIPAGATITAATMTLNMVSGTSTANHADAYQVTGAEWTSASLQWSNKPAANIRLEENISHNNKTKYQFSCLAAVQHWYDGDTTGQHENYGIMLCYHDTTIADYNSVYSADCTDANSRPSLTISYTPLSSSLDVVMDGTLALPLPDVTGTITWVTENATIATVNSAGVVTGHKAGKVDITAFVDGAEYQVFTVYITIPDGVYRVSHSWGLHLATNGGITDNTSVMLKERSESGFSQLCQLWKITHIGSGQYTIRPLHKLNMGLHAGGNVDTRADIVNIGISDSYAGVLGINLWGIETSDDGTAYYLNHVNTRSLGLRPDGYYPSSGMLLTIAQNAGATAFNWHLEQVTGVFMHDRYYEPMDLPDSMSKEVEMGGTYSTAQMGYHVTTSNVNLTWTSGGEDILTVNSKGKVTAHKRGVATITASGSGGGQQYTFNVNVTSVETVYVKNFYDSTYAGNTDKINNISTAVTFLNSVFYDEFKLRFVMDGSPVHYQRDGVDRCPKGTTACDDNCKMPCEEVCGEVCIGLCEIPGWGHHKNFSRIVNRLYNEYFEPNHIVVLWSDSPENSFCNAGIKTEDGQQIPVHDLLDALAATPLENSDEYHHLPVIIVLRNVVENGSCEASMAINLAHEVAHTLGLKEIYLNEYGDDDECIAINDKGEIINTTRHACDIDNDYCIMKNYNCNEPDMLCILAESGAISALCDYCIGKLYTEGIQDRDLYES